MKLYHTARYKISNLENTPMFFAIKLIHAVDGWYQNMRREGDRPHIYRFVPDDRCNIVDIGDDIVKQIAAENDLDLEEYLYMLLSNPDSDEITGDDLTKLLIDNGIDGLRYLDYDPRNFDEDLEAVIIFNPADHCLSWQQIR